MLAGEAQTHDLYFVCNVLVFLALCLVIKQKRIVRPFDFLAFVSAYLSGGNWVLPCII